MIAVVGVQGKALDMKPVQVGRVGAVLKHIVEGVEPSPAVVEDAVEDDANAVVVGGGDQLVEGRQVAEVRVDAEVVEGVIFMVRGRLEYRVEIQRGNTQLGEVVKMIDDAAQIAAHEVI